MSSIDRYIFRTVLGAFVLVLVPLTLAIWMTQALRDLDLITSQGQSILTFVTITSLVIPSLLLLLAPVSLVIAVVYVLSKLTTDSEIIVMNSAGMSPWRLARPYMASALVATLLVAVIGAYLSPKCLRELRRMTNEVRADIVTNVIQPGRFITIEHGLVFYLHQRQPDGTLLGVFVSDRRDPATEVTILAEQGEVTENESRPFILLGHGSLQRHRTDERDPSLVHFDRYAFDLSQFSGRSNSRALSPRELFLWELVFPPANAQLEQVRAEFHDRIVGPIYPLAFTVIVLAFLGSPRTTRQRNTGSLVALSLAIASLRIFGFISLVVGVNAPIALTLQYAGLAITFWFGLRTISQGTTIEPPEILMAPLTRLTERFFRRPATP